MNLLEIAQMHNIPIEQQRIWFPLTFLGFGVLEPDKMCIRDRGYMAGMFHLFTHAMFKALLFLGAGSIIHAVHLSLIHI